MDDGPVLASELASCTACPWCANPFPTPRQVYQRPPLWVMRCRQCTGSGPTASTREAAEQRWNERRVA